MFVGHGVAVGYGVAVGSGVLVGPGVEVGNGAFVGRGVAVGIGPRVEVEVVKAAATFASTVASIAVSASRVPRIPASTVAGTSAVGRDAVCVFAGDGASLVQATAVRPEITRTIRMRILIFFPQCRDNFQSSLSTGSTVPVADRGELPGRGLAKTPQSVGWNEGYKPAALPGGGSTDCPGLPPPPWKGAPADLGLGPAWLGTRRAAYVAERTEDTGPGLLCAPPRIYLGDRPGAPLPYRQNGRPPRAD